MTLIDHQRAVYLSTQVSSAIRASLLETGLTAEMCGEPYFRVHWGVSWEVGCKGEPQPWEDLYTITTTSLFLLLLHWPAHP